MTFEEYKVKFKPIEAELLRERTFEEYIESSKAFNETLKGLQENYTITSEESTEVNLEEAFKYSNYTRKHTEAGREFKEGDLYCYGILYSEDGSTARLIKFHEEEIGTIYDIVEFEEHMLTLKKI